MLDTSHGIPAAGIEVEVCRVEGAERRYLGRHLTGADGRCAGPLLEGEAMTPGTYELEFGVGDYFAAMTPEARESRFLDRVPVRFRITDATADYHVPLVVSRFGYSVYRGG